MHMKYSHLTVFNFPWAVVRNISVSDLLKGTLCQMTWLNGIQFLLLLAKQHCRNKVMTHCLLKESNAV